MSSADIFIIVSNKSLGKTNCQDKNKQIMHRYQQLCLWLISFIISRVRLRRK